MDKHESLYARTCTALIENVVRQKFTPEAVPKIIQDLRAELEQCLRLQLISEEFCARINAKLDRLLRSLPL